MNLIQEALSVVSTLAPTLGTALGGPLGGLAGGLLAKGIGAVIGKKDAAGNAAPATQKEIETAILGGDPQTLLAVKQVEADLQKHMADLGVQEDQLRFQDTASARAREVAVKDATPKIIAYVVIILVLVAEGSMFFVGQPKGIDGVVLGRILGTLDSALMLILGYYFGSSSGSQAKDVTLANLAKQAQT